MIKGIIKFLNTVLIINLVFLAACTSRLTPDSRVFTARSKAALQVEPHWLPNQRSYPETASHSSAVVGIFPLFQEHSSKSQEHNLKAALILTIDGKGLILLWEPRAATARVLARLSQPVERASLSKNQRHLAFLSRGEVKVFSLPTASLLSTLSQIDSRITSLDFQPQKRALLLGGADGRVYRWKYGLERIRDKLTLDEQRKMYERYIGHASVVSVVGYHPHARVFFSGDWQGKLSAWLSYDIDDFSGHYDEDVFGVGFFTDEIRRKVANRSTKESIEYMVPDSSGSSILLGTQKGLLELWAVRGFKKRAEVRAPM